MLKNIVAIDKEHLNQLIQNEINLNGDECDLNHIDVSNIKDMSELFYQSNFNGNISKWNVSNVESMISMFHYSQFNQDISNWNISNLKFTYSMFEFSKFNYDISNWNASNIITMNYMFLDCPAPKPWWYIENNELRKEVIDKKNFQNDLLNSIESKSSHKINKI